VVLAFVESMNLGKVITMTTGTDLSERNVFFTPASYEETIGSCTGGNNWPGLDVVWNCLRGIDGSTWDYMTRDECQERCDASADCYAFDRLAVEGDEICCLFSEGNTGSGITNGRKCYVKRDSPNLNAAASSNVFGFNGVIEAEADVGSPDEFGPMILGAAAGAAMVGIIVAVAVVLVMKKRNAPKNKEISVGQAAHVPDATVDSIDTVVTKPETATGTVVVE